MSIVLLYTTWPDEESAERTGRALVSQGLAACVNVFPGMRSIYAWEGKIESAGEVVMLIKTSEAQAAPARDAVLKAHSYDVPCVLAIPVDAGRSADAYLAWLTSASSLTDRKYP